MDLSSLRFTLKEVIGIAAVIFSIATSVVWLKSDIKQLNTQVIGIEKTVETIDTKVDQLTLDQARLDMVVNFLYAEALKSGWQPSKYTLNEWNNRMENSK